MFEQADAERLRDMLATVVSDGIGGEAQPTFGTAAGKTGTAQTGRYNKQGEERLNFWFAGFYPAEEPRVTVVVMQDDQAEAPVSSACAALFTGPGRDRIDRIRWNGLTIGKGLIIIKHGIRKSCERANGSAQRQERKGAPAESTLPNCCQSHPGAFA